MTSCPACSSIDLEELSKWEGDKHLVSITEFMCKSCACKFEVIERFEVEIVITEPGTGGRSA